MNRRAPARALLAAAALTACGGQPRPESTAWGPEHGAVVVPGGAEPLPPGPVAAPPDVAAVPTDAAVIIGWTEGLQLMTVGERRRFWIPAHLAYGDAPTHPGMPAGMLVFDVELLEVTGAQ